MNRKWVVILFPTITLTFANICTSPVRGSNIWILLFILDDGFIAKPRRTLLLFESVIIALSLDIYLSHPLLEIFSRSSANSLTYVIHSEDTEIPPSKIVQERQIWPQLNIFLFDLIYFSLS